jgi:hypothetical protein
MREMEKLMVILTVLFLVPSLYAQNPSNGGGPPVITDLPDAQLRVHSQSNIYFSVTNFGFIGSQGGDYADYEGHFPVAPGAEFPADSDIDYLFQGALWVGTVLDLDGDPNTLDTLVSVGNDGWWAGVMELWPPPEGFESMWRDSTFGDEEIWAVFYDTATDQSYVPQDPNDQRPHIPIGLEITRNSIGWRSNGYDELFILNYFIENIYDRNLHDLWIGIYYDGDVLHSSENPYSPEEGAQDDLCGFIPYGEQGIAWIADNNGQPYDGQFDYRSSTGIMGMLYLGSSEPDVQTNFNWWISNVNSELDWGPQLQENYDGPYPGGGNGTPGGDKAKYKVLSNGENDYDQVYCALDFTDEGWIAPVANADDLANGFDTRFLISFGPLQIAAGEIETLTVAYLGGNDLHTDPDNYAENLQYNTDDSLSIEEYYNNLDFSDLLIKADTAYYYYQRETGVDNQQDLLPVKTSLLQNYPNPFNAATVLHYGLSQAGQISISIYNVLGQRVMILYEGIQQAGEHKLIWDASAFPSGVYFARLEVGERSESVKMVLLR